MFKADASDATPPPSRQSPAAAAPAAATATVWHHDRSIAASATAVVDEHRGAPQRPPPLQSHCSRCTAVRSVAATIAAATAASFPSLSPAVCSVQQPPPHPLPSPRAFEIAHARGRRRWRTLVTPTIMFSMCEHADWMEAPALPEVNQRSTWTMS